MYYRRNLIQILFSWFCIIMFYVFAVYIVGSIIQAVHGKMLSGKDLDKYEYILVGITGIMTAFMIVIMRFLKGDKKFLKFKKFNPSPMIKSLFIYLMAGGLFYLIFLDPEGVSYLYKLFTKAERLNFTYIFRKHEMSNFNIILSIISMTVFVAIAEEVIFRGIVYNDIKELFSAKSGIIGSAIIFGAIHFYDPYVLGYNMIVIIIRVILTTMYGIFTAYYYEKTGTLWASIISHCLILTFTLIPDFMFKWQIMPLYYSIFILAGFTMLIIYLIKYLLKVRKAHNTL
ncbi:CPBP family intramembrane glutamic endopeptidase [Treponema pedis]|uniref:CPBP family intramembrane glutamic endopeptidase n=1 Tax=Treponema pedis TaxID=409322 RepID=UPI003D1AF9A6